MESQGEVSGRDALHGRPSVLLTDYAWPDTELERSLIEPAGYELIVARAKDAATVRQLVAEHQPAAIMTCWAPVSGDAIESSRGLRHVARMGIGLDNIDLEACSRNGVWVSNVPDYCVEEVSDHAIACLLTWARSLLTFDHAVRAGTWDPAACRIRRVRDLTVGLVGYGKIGRVTARKLGAFGCRVLVHRQGGSPTNDGDAVHAVPLAQLLGESDAVILHLPLTPATHHLINAERLSQMRRGSLLVNVSRGAVVDTPALIDALQQGRLSAALDVVEGEPDIPAPIRMAGNTILTPHIAFSSEASVEELRRRAAEEVIRVLGGNAPLHACNSPRRKA